MPQSDSRETSCGLFDWRPDVLRPLASKKVYLFFYGALGIVRGMFSTYIGATLATLEKEFGIKSKEIAYMMSGNEISQILFLFIMPFIIHVQRRPLWLGLGYCLSAFGCAIMALPYFLRKANHKGEEWWQNNTVLGLGPTLDPLGQDGLCHSTHHPNSLESGCGEDGGRQVDYVSLFIIFSGIVLTGFGNCVYFTFGLTYLDDNSSHENSPVMLGLTYTFRLFGPTMGFLLGAFCLRTNVDPSVDPGYGEEDPRWIGAWWLGYPIIAALLLVFSLPLTLFPQRLPKAGTDAHLKETKAMRKDGLGEDEAAEEEDKPKFKDALKRLLHNKLFMCNLISNIFFLLGLVGYGTFMPKYIQFQFKQKGSSSAGLAGAVGTFSQALGLLTSGFLIARYKPSARFLSGYNFTLGLLFLCFLILFSFLGCDTTRIYGNDPDQPSAGISSVCSQDCSCPTSRPQPVCSKDGVTNFYSPCLAGCLASEQFQPKALRDGTLAKPVTVYDDCSCVREAWELGNTSLSRHWLEQDHLYNLDLVSEEHIQIVRARLEDRPIQQAVEGWCPEDCSKDFTIFLGASFFLMIVSSTGRIGSVLVTLRCIDVRDKSLSMAFSVVSLSLFALLPSPVLFGSLIDSACILWQEECGQTANCLFYDLADLRNILMRVSALIMVIGLVFDFGVFYYSKGLTIFNPEQRVLKRQKKMAEDKDSMVFLDRFASQLSIDKENMFKQ